MPIKTLSDFTFYLFKVGTISVSIVLVFHRILDFKAGLDFYLGPFFYFLFNVFIQKIKPIKTVGKRFENIYIFIKTNDQNI